MFRLLENILRFCYINIKNNVEYKIWFWFLGFKDIKFIWVIGMIQTEQKKRDLVWFSSNLQFWINMHMPIYSYILIKVV